MTSEIVQSPSKTKDPKRVAAGKKGVEAKKLKAELKRKEAELLKKEIMELKSKQIKKEEVPEPLQITKDDDNEPLHNEQPLNVNIYKNYIPLCISIVVVGLGLYVYNSNLKLDKQPEQKQHTPVAPIQKQKEVDPFEFN